MGLCEGVCGRGWDLYDCANRYQLYRPDGRENFGNIYAVGGGFAGLGIVPVFGGICRRRSNRADIGLWVFVGKRCDQGRGEGLFWCGNGGVVGGERRNFRRGYFLFLDGDALSIEKQKELKKSRMKNIRDFAYVLYFRGLGWGVR